ncbi:hypothetical protein GGH92_000036 [Coemansia sp. RSA 2673]|nr:hypothetical protein GGH92_000036 [Coemansia sp. RSA 2673]
MGGSSLLDNESDRFVMNVSGKFSVAETYEIDEDDRDNIPSAKHLMFHTDWPFTHSDVVSRFEISGKDTVLTVFSEGCKYYPEYNEPPSYTILREVRPERPAFIFPKSIKVSSPTIGQFSRQKQILICHLPN